MLGWKSVTALFLAAIFRVTLVLLALLSLAKIRAYMPTVNNNNNNFYHASMNFFEINKEKKTILQKTIIINDKITETHMY